MNSHIKIHVISFLSLLFLGSLCIGQEDCSRIPDIDGVTSATGQLIIDTGAACQTYAEIDWHDKKSSGHTYKLEWGKTQQYGNSENLSLSPSKTKIEDLESDTKYYVNFIRKYGSKTSEIKFSFTTEEAPTNIDFTSFNKGTPTPYFTITNDILYPGYNLQKGDKIVITDLSGKNIFLHPCNNSQSQVKLPEMASGLYLVSAVRNQTVLNKKQVVIGLVCR